MKTVHTYIAYGIGDQEVEPLTLVFDFSVPAHEHVEDFRKFYRQAAGELLDAMTEAAPGGLMDALFAELCARKASLLRVPL